MFEVCEGFIVDGVWWELLDFGVVRRFCIFKWWVIFILEGRWDIGYFVLWGKDVGSVSCVFWLERGFFVGCVRGFWKRVGDVGGWVVVLI